MSDVVTVIRFLGGTSGKPFPYGQGVIDTLVRSPSIHPQSDELFSIFSCRRLAVEHLSRHIMDPGFWRKSPYLVEEPRRGRAVDEYVGTYTFAST